MNPLAVFHRRRGTPFWQTPNALWLRAGSFSIYAAPSSLPVAADRLEMESALRASNRLVALATSTRPTGLASHALILLGRPDQTNIVAAPIETNPNLQDLTTTGKAGALEEEQPKIGSEGAKRAGASESKDTYNTNDE